MIIRAITDADTGAFQDIMKSAIRVICAETYGAEAVAAWVSDENPAHHFVIPEFAFVAGEGKKIIAVGGWSRTDKIDLHPTANAIIKPPTHARINAVYVRPGQEGRGLGAKMMAHLEADITSRSPLRNIYLWSTKNAIPFYEKMGYRPGIDQYPEVAPGHKVMVRYMWKRLG